MTVQSTTAGSGTSARLFTRKAAGLVIDYVAVAIQRRRSVNVERAFAEIPVD
jgi:predicted DNA repair protein MutK